MLTKKNICICTYIYIYMITFHLSHVLLFASLASFESFDGSAAVSASAFGARLMVGCGRSNNSSDSTDVNISNDSNGSIDSHDVQIYLKCWNAFELFSNNFNIFSSVFYILNKLHNSYFVIFGFLYKYI